MCCKLINSGLQKGFFQIVLALLHYVFVGFRNVKAFVALGIYSFMEHIAWKSRSCPSVAKKVKGFEKRERKSIFRCIQPYFYNAFTKYRIAHKRRICYINTCKKTFLPWCIAFGSQSFLEPISQPPFSSCKKEKTVSNRFSLINT